MGALRSDPAVGTTIAGYRIEALLGRGGMSVVYLAEGLRLHRKVALKLIAPELATDERFRDRFLAESELAASLDHPNVIPIFEAGDADGVLFIAMRYVEGQDLRQLLARGSLSLERAIVICAQIAAALDAAHARGLVHRDVKPSNVLIDSTAGPADHVYLADFGLTRRLADAGSGFVSGLSLGTPSYVAPEEIEGHEVDGRADLYSLGCVLHECLLGEPPFPRPSEVAVLFAHLDEAPPSLHARMPDLPEAIDAVIGRALAKVPSERYGTCHDLLEDARSALGIGGTVPTRRRPLLVGLAGALVAAASLLTFFLAREDGALPPPHRGGSLVRIDAQTNQVTATISVGEGPSAVAVGRSGVWVANRGGGTISRIDPETNRVELVAPVHGSPEDIAVSPKEDPFTTEAAVVTNGPLPANVSLIDGATGTKMKEISLAPAGSLVGVAHVAAGVSGLWVATADRRVGRVNKERGRLVDAVSVPAPADERVESYFSGLAVGADGVWVVGDPMDPAVWRLDPTTGDLVAMIALPFAPKDVAAGAGAVWVTSQIDDTVSRIDPATNKVTATVRVGRGAAGVAVGAGSVWVANQIDGTVSRIDPRTLQAGTIDVDGNPGDLAVGDGGVWVASQAAPARAALDRNVLKIGVLPVCEGSFGFLHDSTLAGAELPLLRRGASLAGSGPAAGVKGAGIAGREVRLLFGCGDGTAETALSEARRLVESERVDLLIGGDYPGESLALREYARRRPGITFVSGISSGQAVTLSDPAPNYFRFGVDGAQQLAGLGSYAYNELGWRRAVTIGDRVAFDYAQTAGFVAEFCAVGGTVAKQIWVPLGTKNVSRAISEIPDGVDGFLIAALPATTLSFIDRLRALDGNLARRLVGGLFLGFSDVTKPLGDRMAGVVFADSPGLGDRRPAWEAYVSDFADAFPDLASYAGFPNGIRLFDSVEAIVQALELVDGDLSDGQRRFQVALTGIELDAPDGHIRLDERRQAIGSSFLIQYRPDASGKLQWKPFRTVANVEQTFNGYFGPGGPLLGDNTIKCKHGNPPPWARAGG
jgi:YVTN family beta-propeller protein